MCSSHSNPSARARSAAHATCAACRSIWLQYSRPAEATPAAVGAGGRPPRRRAASRTRPRRAAPSARAARELGRVLDAQVERRTPTTWKQARATCRARAAPSSCSRRRCARRAARARPGAARASAARAPSPAPAARSAGPGPARCHYGHVARGGRGVVVAAARRRARRPLRAPRPAKAGRRRRRAARAAPPRRRPAPRSSRARRRTRLLAPRAGLARWLAARRGGEAGRVGRAAAQGLAALRKAHPLAPPPQPVRSAPTRSSASSARGSAADESTSSLGSPCRYMFFGRFQERRYADPRAARGPPPPLHTSHKHAAWSGSARCCWPGSSRSPPRPAPARRSA